MLSPTPANTGPAYKRAAEELRSNAGQWEAYESHGNCVVLAGPGSGKTKTLTIKLARMLAEDVRAPRGIACITYSSECARELRRRLDRLGVSEARNLYIGTVHSFCLANILLPYAHLVELDLPRPWMVAAEDVQEVIFARAWKQVRGDTRPDRTLMDSYRRTHLERDADDWEDDPATARVIEVYEQELHSRGYIDFDDMILGGWRLVRDLDWLRKTLRARFPILIVDEYQDLGVPLDGLVQSLCFDAGVRLLAVGDPDQSIYGFTGARPQLLRQLAERDDVQCVRLRMNYRCGTDIVRASEVILNAEPHTFDTPKDAPNGIVYEYEYPGGLANQAEAICNELISQALARDPKRKLGDIAVLYVDKNDGDVIADAAAASSFSVVRIDNNAPYKKTPLTRWLEDCATWCAAGWQKGEPRLSVLIGDWLRFNRLSGASDSIASPIRSALIRFLWSHRCPDIPLCDWFGDIEHACLQLSFQTVPELKSDSEAFSRLKSSCRPRAPYCNYTLKMFSGQGGSSEHLNLLTLHSAKGLEFDVVFIMGLEQGRIPSWYDKSDAQVAEKRRLFYVGVTRGKHEVHLTYSGWYNDKRGYCHQDGPSQFLRDLSSRLAD